MWGLAYGRLAILVGALLGGFLLTQLVHPLSDLIGIEDGLQFLLASLVFVSAWRPTVRVFSERPLRFARLLSLGISLWSLSFMLAAIWSITWRSFGYNEAWSDNGLRYGFRFIAILGSVCVLAAPEFFEQEVTGRRASRFALTMACIVATVLVLVYGSHLGRRHDAAPTPTVINKRMTDG